MPDTSIVDESPPTPSGERLPPAALTHLCRLSQISASSAIDGRNGRNRSAKLGRRRRRIPSMSKVAPIHATMTSRITMGYAGTRGRRRGPWSRIQSSAFRFSQDLVRFPGR